MKSAIWISISKRISEKEIKRLWFEKNFITLPTFEITDRPQIRYSDIQTRRYNLLDRARERVSSDLSQALDSGFVGSFYGTEILTTENPLPPLPIHEETR